MVESPDFIPFEETEVDEEQNVSAPDFIPFSEENKAHKTVYLEDKDELRSYPANYNEDELNHSLQTEVYGEPKNKFLLNVNTGIDILSSMGKGAAAFFPAAALRTLGGSIAMEAETAEEWRPMPTDMTSALAGNYMPAIFRTVKALAATQTNIDEDLAKDGRELADMASQVLNNKFFKPGESTAEQVAFDLGGAGASLFTALALTALTKNPNAASLLFGQIAASDTYLRGREEGASPREAYTAALQNFATEYGLEYAGLEIFTRYLRGSKTLLRIGAKMASEGFQEAGQTLGGELSAKLNNFGEEDWAVIGTEMLYSGAIGFVTGGVAGAAQVIKENKSVIGKMRQQGVTDAEIESFAEVMAKKHETDFKAVVRKAVMAEINAMKEVKDPEQKIVVDEMGIPVTLGAEELSEDERFRYQDKDVINLETAERFSMGAVGELPQATPKPQAEIVTKEEDPVVQARINQIESELKPLYDSISALQVKDQKTPLSKAELTQYLKVQRQISRLEVERDEVGFDANLLPTEVEAGKTIRLTAGALYRQKIEDVKNQVRQFNSGFQAGKDVTKEDIKSFQTKLVDLISISEVLTPAQRERMLKAVKTTQTETNMRKRVGQLAFRIKELEQANAKKIYTRAITRLLKKAKDRKFDADTREIFDEIIKMHEAEEPIDAQQLQEAWDGTLASRLKFDIALFNSIDPSLAELQNIFQDLKLAFESGIDNRVKERRQKQAILQSDIDSFIRELIGSSVRKGFDPNKQETKSGKRLLPIGMLTFDTIINRITRASGKGEGKSWGEKRFDTFKAYHLKTKVDYSFKYRLNEAYKQIYKLKDNNASREKIHKDMALKQSFRFLVGVQDEVVDEETGEVITEAQPGEWKTIELTQAQIRKRVMEWQRAEGRRTLEKKNGYTEELMAELEKTLTAEDYAFIRFQFKMYDDLYAIVNPIYKRLMGKNLAYSEFYSPLFAIGGESQDMSIIDVMAGQTGDTFFGASITNKDNFKIATGGSDGLTPIDDLLAMQKYISDMSHFIGYADLTADIKNILLNREVVQIIKEKFGDITAETLKKEFKRMSSGGWQTDYSTGWKWVNNFTRPIARVYLINPLIGIKQLQSAIAYMGEVPIAQYARFATEFINPATAGKVMKIMENFRGDLLMQARGDQYEREIKATADAIRNSKDFLSADERLKSSQFHLGTMRLGDRGAIYLGSYIMYQYDTQVKKLSHEEAMDHFRRFTNTSMQSPDPFQLAPNLADTHPLSRLLTIFTQAPTQYFNLMYRAVKNWKTNGIQDTSRKIFVYHALIPLLWQYVANGFYWDNEEELKAAILGPLAYIHIVGDGLENLTEFLIAMSLGETVDRIKTNNDLVETWLAASRNVAKGVRTIIDDGGLDSETTIKLIQDLAVASGPVAGAAAGIVRYGAGLFRGVQSSLDGEYVDALKYWMGYSQYAVDKPYTE